MTTVLLSLTENFAEIPNEFDYKTGDIKEAVLDFSLSLKTRLNCVSDFFATYGWDSTLDLVSRLNSMFELSPIASLKTYIYNIGVNTEIDPFIRSTIAPVLIKTNKQEMFGFEIIEKVYPDISEQVGTPYKIQLLTDLLNSDKEKFVNLGLEYYKTIMCETKISSKFKITSILSLESKIENKTDRVRILTDLCLCFFNSDIEELQYRIISAQRLFTIGYTNKSFERKLYKLAKSEQTPYNHRADIADMLIRYASDFYKTRAKKIITTLGRVETKEATFGLYGNAQNVHNEEIEKSVQEGIAFLETMGGSQLSYEATEKEIKEEMTRTNVDEKTRENVQASLDRIYMDSGLYSKFTRKLSQILVKVWHYSTVHSHPLLQSQTKTTPEQNQERTNAIRKRLIEELAEMSGTCSSGFVSRLVNVLSGFGDFAIRISWGDQVYGGVSGRLGKRIREMDDLDKQEKILGEMTIPSNDYDLRSNFLDFFASCISEIKCEMYEEFKAYLNETDFDLYFRKAVLKYETGEFE